jgi:hypothetical protein
MRDRESLIEKIKVLPTDRIAEVEDFVDFIVARAHDRMLVRAISSASEPASARGWINSEDDAYDAL